MGGHKMSNLQKLKAGGFIHHHDKVPKEDLQRIESLTDEEVETLIRITEKMGEDFGTDAPPDTYSHWNLTNTKRLANDGLVQNVHLLPSEDMEIIESLDRELISTLLKAVKTLGDEFGKDAPSGTYWR
jgi:galactose-1-phosphate uridylyltransferase